MIVIPAIDLSSGKCVRLTQGAFDRVTAYSDDPVSVALEFERQGARKLHLVDLDGAEQGRAGENLAVIERVIGALTIPVELGGGIRSAKDARAAVRAGANEIIVGSAAVENPSLVRDLTEEFPGRIVVAIDARDGKVRTRGWKVGADVDAVTLAKQVAHLGVARVIYTDIARDGELEGANVDAAVEIARASGARVTVSGGVSTLDDLVRAREQESQGIDAVIIGKALYEMRFSLTSALRVCGMRDPSVAAQ